MSSKPCIMVFCSHESWLRSHGSWLRNHDSLLPGHESWLRNHYQQHHHHHHHRTGNAAIGAVRGIIAQANFLCRHAARGRGKGRRSKGGPPPHHPQTTNLPEAEGSLEGSSSWLHGFMGGGTPPWKSGFYGGGPPKKIQKIIKII